MVVGRFYNYNSKYVALIFASILSILLLLLSICSTAYGFDITDEGYYYINYEFAGRYEGNSLTSFGLFYRSLYEALGKNIQLLRSVDILVTYFLSLLVIRISFRSGFSAVLANYFRTNKAPFLLSIFFASFSLLLYNVWLLSPNYNTLGFTSCLLFLLSFLLLRPIYCISELSGFTSLTLLRRFYILISPLSMAMALTLAWIAKPTTFIALSSLSLVSACYLVFWVKTQKNCIMLIFIVAYLVFVGFLGAFILFFYSSFATYFEDIVSSLQYTSLLASGQTSVWHSVSKLLSASRLIFATTFLVVLQLVVFAWLRFRSLPNTSKTKVNLLRFLVLFLISLLFCVILSATTSYSALAMSGLFTFPFVFYLSLIKEFDFWRVEDSEIVVSAPTWLSKRKYSCLISSLAFAVPLAFAIGTNVGYEGKFVCAFVFILIGTIEFAQRCVYLRLNNSSNTLSTLCVSIVVPFLCSLLLVLHGLYAPFRQESNFFTASQYARIHSTNLKFSDSVAQFYSNLSSVLRSNGFDDGTPVLDLTHHGSPGLIYAVKGFPIGRPWMLRGYPGSNAYMLQSLKDISCLEASDLWIFADKNDLYSNPTYLSGLSELGISPLDPSSFELIHEDVFQAEYGLINGEKEKSQLLVFRPLQRQCD